MFDNLCEIEEEFVNVFHDCLHENCHSFHNKNVSELTRKQLITNELAHRELIGKEINVYPSESSFNFLVPSSTKITTIDNSKSKVVTKPKVISNKSVSVSASRVTKDRKVWEAKKTKEKKRVSPENKTVKQIWKQKNSNKKAYVVPNKRKSNLNESCNKRILKNNVDVNNSKFVNACLNDMYAFGFSFDERIDDSYISSYKTKKEPMKRWVPYKKEPNLKWVPHLHTNIKGPISQWVPKVC
jgi:hypothetical protein